MKFCSVVLKGLEYPAIYKDNKISLLKDYGINYKTLEDVARFITDEQLAILKKPINKTYQLNKVDLLPAIQQPFQEIIIMENNFILNGDPLPTYFYKKASYATCSGTFIPSYPKHVKKLDYQVEVCAVVRGDCYQVSMQEAKNRIFGYLLINNVIGRDLTLRHRRPYIATSLDGFLPMGYFIVTPDEMPAVIGLRSYVNGQLRQNSTLDKVKFDFSYAISDLSRISVLRGGSLISSGTPEGCGKDQKEEIYLVSGDMVTVEADGLGHISNVVD